MNKDAKGGQGGAHISVSWSYASVRGCLFFTFGGVWSRTLILRRTCEVSESYGLERELHVH